MTVWELPVLCVLSILGGIKSICGLRIWRGQEPSLLWGWKEKQMYVLSGVWLAFYAVIWFCFGRSAVLVRSADMLCTYGILAAVDGKRKIVPDSVLVCYFTGQMLLGALTVTPGRLLWVAFTGTIFAVIVSALAWFSRGKIGIGDAKLLGVTAMTAGWEFVLQILIPAILLSFAYSVWLMAARKKNIRTEFPFVPFLTAGMLVYIVSLLLY